MGQCFSKVYPYNGLANKIDRKYCCITFVFYKNYLSCRSDDLFFFVNILGMKLTIVHTGPYFYYIYISLFISPQLCNVISLFGCFHYVTSMVLQLDEYKNGVLILKCKPFNRRPSSDCICYYCKLFSQVIREISYILSSTDIASAHYSLSVSK